MEELKKQCAIVLAGGSGSRMQSTTKKQYLLINGKPLIFYALKQFQDSFIDEIVLVVAKGETDYCKKESRFQASGSVFRVDSSYRKKISSNSKLWKYESKPYV